VLVLQIAAGIALGWSVIHWRRPLGMVAIWLGLTVLAIALLVALWCGGVWVWTLLPHRFQTLLVWTLEGAFALGVLQALWERLIEPLIYASQSKKRPAQ
jgi:hypothetical protein